MAKPRPLLRAFSVTTNGYLVDGQVDASIDSDAERVR